MNFKFLFVRVGSMGTCQRNHHVILIIYEQDTNEGLHADIAKPAQVVGPLLQLVTCQAIIYPNLPALTLRCAVTGALYGALSTSLLPVHYQALIDRGWRR